MNISCFLIGKDTSVCVRLFTCDELTLKPWIEHLKTAPCHLHCHAYIDSVTNGSIYKYELQEWLKSSVCASAVMLLDSRMSGIVDSDLIDLCEKAKTQGVFIGVFADPDQEIANPLKQLEPNWYLPIQAPHEAIRKKVNEVLGVVRFTEFIQDKNLRLL